MQFVRADGHPGSKVAPRMAAGAVSITITGASTSWAESATACRRVKAGGNFSGWIGEEAAEGGEGMTRGEFRADAFV